MMFQSCSLIHMAFILTTNHNKQRCGEICIFSQTFCQDEMLNGLCKRLAQRLVVISYMICLFLRKQEMWSSCRGSVDGFSSCCRENLSFHIRIKQLNTPESLLLLFVSFLCACK